MFMKKCCLCSVLPDDGQQKRDFLNMTNIFKIKKGGNLTLMNAMEYSLIPE